MELKDKPTNCVDPDEVAHNEPLHLDLRCLPSQTFLHHKNVHLIVTLASH